MQIGGGLNIHYISSEVLFTLLAVIELCLLEMTISGRDWGVIAIVPILQLGIGVFLIIYSMEVG